MASMYYTITYYPGAAPEPADAEAKAVAGSRASHAVLELLAGYNCLLLYYTILYYTILYYTILYYTILYYTIYYIK